MSYVFFRNDDVRDTLDDELLKITELCVKNEVPIWQAIEPDNVSDQVCEWLIKIKCLYPQLVFLFQHGFDHNLNNKFSGKMEFGGHRSYADQYESLRLGMKIMDEKFSDLWTRVISFPFGTYNRETMQAVVDLGYIATTTSVRFDTRNNIKNFVGRLLKADTILGKKVSYHLRKRPNSALIDVGVSVNLISKYLDESNAEHHSVDFLRCQIDLVSKKTDVVGILLHHRFHKHHLNLVSEILEYVRQKAYDKFTEETLNNGYN